MAAQRILLVEDDPAFGEMLGRFLARRGFLWERASSGSEGLSRVSSFRPDLILMDWALGRGLQGIDVCARLKANPRTRQIPIIVLTGARVNFEDELSALGHGADLYLTKGEILGSSGRASRFLAYVRTLARRPFQVREGQDQALRFSGLEIDPLRHAVKTRRELITNLSTKQFDLLYVLAKRHPLSASRRFLLRAVWRNCVRDKEVDVAVCRLKARLGGDHEPLIESVRGKGYRLAVSPLIRPSGSPKGPAT